MVCLFEDVRGQTLNNLANISLEVSVKNVISLVKT